VEPVQAFALPLFAMMALVSPALKWAADTRTGAALILFEVKVAAATAGKSETTRPRSTLSSDPSLIPEHTADARKPLGAVIPPPISKNAGSIFAKRLYVIQQQKAHSDQFSR
jgi:hypothetical protein